MKYRPLANTGVFVSELCLGAMTFGSQWEMIGALDQKDADALVHRSLDEGINFFSPNLPLSSVLSTTDRAGRLIPAASVSVQITKGISLRMNSSSTMTWTCENFS